MNVLEMLAREAGATDLFVFHRVADDRYVNVDGHGRGAGWAGNVALDATCEPFIARASSDGLARVARGVPSRLFGPYWSAEASAVRLDDHTVVVFAGEGTAAVAEAELRSIASRAADTVSEVPVTKRLADELEATQATLAVASLRPRSLEEAGGHISTVAADALSCEFGAMVLLEPRPRLFLRDGGWRPAASADEIVTGVLALRALVRDGLHVEQDLAASPFGYPPLSREDGLVARLTAPIGAPGEPVAMLMVAHAGTAPRGFTSLCQTVALKIAETALTVLDEFL